MKLYYIILGIFIGVVFSSNAQVGVGTTTPEGELDVKSSNTGLLIPRVTLTGETDNTTVTIPGGAGVKVSTMVYNTGAGGLKPAGFYYWEGAKWVQLVSDGKQVAVGWFRLTYTGTMSISSLPFKPKKIVFKAFANVWFPNLDANNGQGSNYPGARNNFGYMTGFAKDVGGSIEQQVISNVGSANSINNFSRYANPNQCIGMRYATNNGASIGISSGAVTSFNDNGFTLSLTDADDSTKKGDLLIFYTAYKY
jgi:hypothetical protein